MFIAVYSPFLATVDFAVAPAQGDPFTSAPRCAWSLGKASFHEPFHCLGGSFMRSMPLGAWLTPPEARFKMISRHLLKLRSCKSVALAQRRSLAWPSRES